MKQSATQSFDTCFALRLHAASFPFTCELSLAPLIAFWQQSVSQGHALQSTLWSMIQEKLRQAPELCEPITDLEVIAQHRALIDILMTVVFPQASWEQTYAAAMIPFQFRSFYATPSFGRLGLAAEDGTLSGRTTTDAQTLVHVKMLHAYAFILHQVYGIQVDFEYPLIFTTTDPETGLDRHFKPNMDGRFIQIKTVGDVPPLTDDVKQRLLANLADPQVLMTLLPPEHFVFQGFGVLTADDVTDQEVLSSLKRDLIEKESIISKVRFCSLQDKLRTLFRKPHLLFGLAALQDGQVLVLNAGAQIEYG